jgi:hypothetical protein
MSEFERVVLSSDEKTRLEFDETEEKWWLIYMRM